MKHKLTQLFIILFIALGAMRAEAITVREAFTSAPRQVLPLLDRNTRLDMLDYYDSGINKESTNTMDGTSSIISLSPQAVSVKLTDASEVTIALLPAAPDTLVAVIQTVQTPAPDSHIAIYSPDWKRTLTTQVFRQPTLADWLTSEGKKNLSMVQQLVPFLLIDYSLDPTSGTLTLKNNTKNFLSADIYEIVASFIKPSLTYRWDGRKFTAAQ